MKTFEVFTNLDMVALGQRVQEAREGAGLTQQTLAWRAEVRNELISRLEHGHCPGLRVQTLYSICQVLGLSADALLGLRREAL